MLVAKAISATEQFDKFLDLEDEQLKQDIEVNDILSNFGIHRRRAIQYFKKENYGQLQERMVENFFENRKVLINEILPEKRAAKIELYKFKNYSSIFQ